MAFTILNFWEVVPSAQKRSLNAKFMHFLRLTVQSRNALNNNFWLNLGFEPDLHNYTAQYFLFFTFFFCNSKNNKKKSSCERIQPY